MEDTSFDAVIIGSGFGGSMTAKKLCEAGWKVAMIERGDWIKRGPENWATNGSIDLTSNYDKSHPYHVLKGGNKKQMGVYSGVGGPSTFYGGVSFRFRENDFDPPKEIVGSSGAEWPISYEDLEPYYGEAEQLLQIAGESGVDPTEPFRKEDFPQQPGPYAKISLDVKSAAESLGMKPFHLPLAINYHDSTRSQCQLCTTCDTFACAIKAKNDLDTMLLRNMSEKKLTIFANTLAFKIHVEESEVKELHCHDRKSGKEFKLRTKLCICSAGALASPHLILASELDKLNSSGDLIGRYLMRHVNAIVFGIFPGVADKESRFHKELAILDYYFGHPDIPHPKHKLGSLQQVPTPPGGLVENEVPWPLGKVASMGVKLLTGLLAIAEDQPQYNNHIGLDHTKLSKYNMPAPVVSHEYTKRDMEAVNALINQAKRVMKKSGALVNYVHHIRTFSHSAGTIRMGSNPETSPLDRNCNFRGIDNLYVVDACFMPTSAAVNPSLTISANALRVGDHLVKKYNF